MMPTLIAFAGGGGAAARMLDRGQQAEENDAQTT